MQVKKRRDLVFSSYEENLVKKIIGYEISQITYARLSFIIQPTNTEKFLEIGLLLHSLIPVNTSITLVYIHNYKFLHYALVQGFPTRGARQHLRGCVMVIQIFVLHFCPVILSSSRANSSAQSVS